MSAPTIVYDHDCGRRHPDDPAPCAACIFEMANDPKLVGEIPCCHSVPPGPDWGGDPADLLDCERPATFLIEVVAWDSEKGQWVPDCWAACDGHVGEEVRTAVGYCRLRLVEALLPISA